MLDEYLEKLGGTDFANRCTATQLQQAIAYPLLVAALVSRGSWIESGDARHVVLVAADRLFRTAFPGSNTRGLLTFVALRYQQEGRSDVFEKVIGDGTLWLALIAAVSRVDWHSDSGSLERALTLREIAICDPLVTTAEVGRLAPLIPRLNLTFETADALSRADYARSLLEKVEQFLHKHCGVITKQQTTEHHDVGDLMWRESGWGIVRDAAPMTAKVVSVYWRLHGEVSKTQSANLINVTKAGKRYRELHRLLSRL